MLAQRKRPKKPKKLNILLLIMCFVLYTSSITVYADDTVSGSHLANKEDDGGHIWNEWITERESTCQTNGLRYRICNRFPESPHIEYEQLPLADHKYTQSIKEATCEEDGLITYTCIYCGEGYTETITKLGHDYGEWITDEEPEAGVAGHMYCVCRNDSSHVLEETIPPLALKAEEAEDVIIPEPMEEAETIVPAANEPPAPEAPEDDIEESIPGFNKMDVIMMTAIVFSAAFFGFSIYWDYKVINWDKKKREEFLKSQKGA